MTGSNDERENTLNQLLTEMDGFEEKNNIMVFAATNLIKFLDPALTRSGRFDKKVFFDLMTEAETVYFNTNEHYRQVVEIETREDRFIKQCKTDFPAHKWEKSNQILQQIRGVKEPEEIELIQKACNITEKGFRRILPFVKPKIMEYEIEAEFMHEFLRNRSKGFAYTPIIGSGYSACVLHYIENNKTHIEDGELVLMDLGAEYHGYTADVTRTIPANGTFTTEQKLLYDIVYEAQEEGINAYKIGSSMSKPNKIARRIINEGLANLGIIKAKDSNHSYFPHGTSHHIGLDVHDPGNYKKFKENMVVTMEPGIYIPYGSNCDEKWWGIGIRIEDDILITKNGPVNLSALAPRKSDEIEAAMKLTSPLSIFNLPKLD